MNMGRPPRVRMIEPRIGTRLDREEAIFAVLIGHAAASADEIWIQRRLVLIHLMMIAAGGVRLPDLDQRIWHRPFIFVQHPPDDNQPLANRLAAGPGVTREIIVSRLYRLMTE